MTKANLNDLQKLILSAAIARDDGNVLPPPENLGDLSASIRSAIVGLVERGFAEETETVVVDRIWRRDGDTSFGLVITEIARTMMAGTTTGDHTVPAERKIDVVIGLLRREDGATLGELVEATGWLPHSARAALTGLRKKGHVIDKAVRAEGTCYLIAEAA